MGVERLRRNAYQRRFDVLVGLSQVSLLSVVLAQEVIDPQAHRVAGVVGIIVEG